MDLLNLFLISLSSEVYCKFRLDAVVLVWRPVDWKCVNKCNPVPLENEAKLQATPTSLCFQVNIENDCMFERKWKKKNRHKIAGDWSMLKA